MSCAPWLSRTRRGGCNAAASGVVVAGVKLSDAKSADGTSRLLNAEKQQDQPYQRLLSLPSAGAAGTQQQRGRVWQLKQRRGQRKSSREVEEGSRAAPRRDCGVSVIVSPEANKEGEGHRGVVSLHPQEQSPRSMSAQRRTAAEVTGSNDEGRSRSNVETGVSGSRRRRSSGAAENNRIQTRSSCATAGRTERINSHTPVLDVSSAATVSNLSLPTVATANRGSTTTAGINDARAPLAVDAAAATAAAPGRRAISGEAIDNSDKRQLRPSKQPGKRAHNPPGALEDAPEKFYEFQKDRRQSDMAESVSRSRERSFSSSPAAHGQLVSPSSEVSDAASEQTAALPATAKGESAGDARRGRRATGGVRPTPEAGISTARTHRKSEMAAADQGSVSPGAYADCGEYEDGRNPHIKSGHGSHYTRHSVLAGRRRTGGRLTQRWSSVFLRSRHPTTAGDNMPSVLPMSETDWIIVDRLSRKMNSSNFATVLKAYLIIKTRIAAQRANKEYAHNRRKGRPGTALRLLLQRQNNRVALRVRAADAGEGAAAAAGPPSAANAATTAAALHRVEAAATEMKTHGHRGRRESTGSERSNRDSPGGGGSHNRSNAEQQDMAAALHVAASAGGGAVPGCGVITETPDVSLSSTSFAADESSAASYSLVHHPPHEQNRVAGLKGVGDVGRMQAHQSLLGQRLAFLGLRSVRIRGDGNCLFRSCSYNLYGTEEYHRYVRLLATQHMCSDAYRKDYAIFFEYKHEFDTYLRNMQRLGTWGDELCVRAIADTFECTIHIITSTDSNWYLRYDPQLSPLSSQGEEQDDEDDAANARQCAAVALPHLVKATKHIFLTYISPIHYNAFTIAEDNRSERHSD